MPLEFILFAFHLVTALVIVRLRNLFAAAMMTGIFSLLSAGLFVLMDAVDVAFTEAAVGAGISTILILGALALTGNEEKQSKTKLMPLVVVALTGAALLYGTLDMPHYGDPEAPIHQHVAPGFIEGTEHHFGIPNIVTAVLGSYRGYDTFGETTVVFMAAVGVSLLLSRKREDEEP
jgi:multicomponent Na+:H+ antiporter subunit B